MRAKKVTLAALALAAGLSLTACQGNEDSASSNVSGPSASSGGSSSSPGGGSSSSSSSTGGSTTSSGGTSGGGSEAGKDATQAAPGSGGGKITTGSCKTANLAFSTSHGMGEGDLIVRLKNTGDACFLKGFPGVDLRSQDAGRPLSAKRSDVPAPTVTLRSGESTRFTLHYPPNNTGGTGAYVSAMVVTPPNETHSKTLPVSLSLPVEVGADQKVIVDPVGTGKQ
ncbi:DUF4232 domain-containing protein [Streptomyces albus subsp. chlorinus]|uniref:DUF4232 domain-containing protein n=1 Tax=Streptomyces albus TaxID=1888 RepID=UPI00156F3407|nr:DUF4232 domain-containing protein [Streptomyces albus]NSC22870.1 DUF4232 domain-containing protein [Streptomyces albus subsp. chlorinus]